MSRLRSAVQEEIQQRRPFSSPAEEAVVALVRTADLMRRALTHVVEPRGITLQQYNVLRILRGAGAGGLPTLEIAQRMIEHAPGITRLLDRLERKRLVVRRRCGRDRRRVLCSIAPAGLALLARMETPIARADESWAGRLRPGEVAELVRMLDMVRSASGEDTKKTATASSAGGLDLDDEEETR